jgi:hypothetical protein
MGGNGESIWIEKDSKKVVFDLTIPIPKGVLFAMYFARDTEVAGAIRDNITKNVTIQQAHEGRTSLVVTIHLGTSLCYIHQVPKCNQVVHLRLDHVMNEGNIFWYTG